LIEEILRLHANEARLAVLDRIAGGAQHGATGAAAANPAGGYEAVVPNDSLGAGLSRRRCYSADHGCKGEGFALGL
jgi:hypothetical protein